MTSGQRSVLIVTYYWPPSGGSGVQRWLKFVKYLTRLGWNVYVFTPENPSVEARDESLVKDVPAVAEIIKLPIWEPYSLFQRLSFFASGKKMAGADFVSTGKRSLFQRLATFIRGNFFIPDPRVFWVRPSVKFLTDFIRERGIQKVITTGPPHSMHLIGLALKRKYPDLFWVADFRDPWSEWDVLHTLSLTRLARWRHAALERKVLTRSDKVITVSPYLVKRMEALGGREVNLITNGYDEEDFPSAHRAPGAVFTLRHLGTVDELRDPRPVLEALHRFIGAYPQAKEEVRLEFIGPVNSALKSYVHERNELRDVVVFRTSVPHSKVVPLLTAADVLLLILAHTALAEGNLPGKFFEYLASGTPILTCGPVHGDAGAILRETTAGEIFERTDIPGMAEAIARLYRQWKHGGTTEARNTLRYTRANLTRQLIALLE
jgi:glycosyltransferase involved in cell wall biosynthesis